MMTKEMNVSGNTANLRDSFYDHSDFLKSGSRYSFLFDLDPTDYKAWASGLKKAGYATNPDYANMLIRKIEENNLGILIVDIKPSGKYLRQTTVLLKRLLQFRIQIIIKQACESCK